MRRLLAAGVTWDPGLKPSVEGVAMAARRRKGDWEPWRSGVNWDDMTMGKFWGNPEVGLSSVQKQMSVGSQKSGWRAEVRQA